MTGFCFSHLNGTNGRFVRTIPVSMLNDLRFAFRTLSRTPIVTLMAILSLALGIGGNTAMFSMLAQILLRGLPVPLHRQRPPLGQQFQQQRGKWRVHLQLSPGALFLKSLVSRVDLGLQ